MDKKHYLNSLISDKLFHFNRLAISSIDNEPVAKVFSNTVLEQEVCLFSTEIETGDTYYHFLHQQIIRALQSKQPLPIVRFADGEYAFYNKKLDCNGLYKQAEAVATIKKIMPLHIAALQYVADHGLLAPLVYPGNSNIDTMRLLSFLIKNSASTGADFLDFIHVSGISLTSKNYIPFYLVYAYLTSADFIQGVDKKNLTILNSDFNEESCKKWFARYDSHPNIEFVNIPSEYVATRWENIKSSILNKIPSDTELCLVGAGVGALLICKDVAERFSIPAIDAGHILNMMNDRVDKSNGARLYTLRKTHE